MASAVLLIAALALSPVIGGGFGELAAGVLQILVFAAVAVCAISSHENRSALVRVPGLIPLGVFLAAVVASALFTEAIYYTLSQLLFVFACAGAYVLAAAMCREMKYSAGVVWAVVLSSLAICVMGIRDYATLTGGGSAFWKSLMGSGDHARLFGPFVNPGFFAGYLVVALPVTLGAYLVTRKSLLAVLAGLAVVVETLALMLTGTKFGVVAAVASLVLFFIIAAATRALRRSKFARMLALAVVMLPLLVVFSAPVVSRISAAESGGSQVHSTTFRIYTWKATANMIKAHPWTGVGPGVYSIAYPRYTIAGPTKYAHDSYLQIAAESGLIALGALVVLLAVIAWRTFAAIVRGAKEPADHPRKPAEQTDGITWKDLVPYSARRVVACSLFAALAGSAIRNLADSDWYVIGIALPFWILAGALVGASGAAHEPLEIGRRLRTGLAVVCGVLIAVSLSFAAGDYLAGDLQLSPAASSLQQAREQMERVRMATVLSPLDPEYHRTLSKYLVSPQLGSREQAIRQAEMAIRLSPTDAANYYNRALIAAHMDEPNDAVKYLRESLKYNPTSTQTLFLLASSYRQLDDTPHYEAVLKRLLAIEDTPYEQIKGTPELVDTTFAYAHVYFGQKYLREHDYDAAAEHFGAAVDRLKRWRSNANILKMALATGMLTTGEKQSLLDLLRESYTGLADAYEGMGEDTKAEQAREKADS